MKATMKHRLDKLETAGGKGAPSIHVITTHYEKPQDQAIAEAGIEREPGDMVLLLSSYDEASRDAPARLLSA
jgi:hypothetical protein